MPPGQGSRLHIGERIIGVNCRGSGSTLSRAAEPHQRLAYSQPTRWRSIARRCSGTPSRPSATRKNSTAACNRSDAHARGAWRVQARLVFCPLGLRILAMRYALHAWAACRHHEMLHQVGESRSQRVRFFDLTRNCVVAYIFFKMDAVFKALADASRAGIARPSAPRQRADAG